MTTPCVRSMRGDGESSVRSRSTRKFAVGASRWRRRIARSWPSCWWIIRSSWWTPRRGRLAQGVSARPREFMAAERPRLDSVLMAAGSRPSALTLFGSGMPARVSYGRLCRPEETGGTTLCSIPIALGLSRRPMLASPKSGLSPTVDQPLIRSILRLLIPVLSWRRGLVPMAGV